MTTDQRRRLFPDTFAASSLAPMRQQFEARAEQAVTDGIRAGVERAAAAYGEQLSQVRTYVREHTQAVAMGFGGAGLNRSNGSKWNGGMSNPYGGMVVDHYRTRQQVRDVVQDTPEAKAIIKRFADSVIGSGLVLSAEPDVEALGLTPEDGERWARAVNQAFDRWARSKKQHRSRLFNFYQIQRLLSIGSDRDNDQFMRFYYDKAPDLLNPLQVEIIDPNQIRGDALTSTVMTAKFPDGILRALDGSESAYQIWVQDPGRYTYQAVEIPRVGDKSGRLMMIHGFTPEFAGQGRGFPSLGAAIQFFENLTDFQASTIKRAINQSQFVMYVKPSKDKPSSNPLDGQGNAPGGNSLVQAGSPGSAPNPAANAVTLGAGVAFTPVEEANFKVPGSTFLANLDAGEDLGQLGDTSPSQNYGEFVDSFLSFLCAEEGIPLEVLKMKFSANYSASRAALLMFYEVVQMKRNHLADDFLDPTYEMFLAGEIAAGRIACPGWSDPRLRAAWLNCRWNGSPMPNIDPSQTADADAKYVDMGAKTLDDVARETNGSSGRSNRAKLTKEFAERRAAGMLPFRVNYTVSESTSKALTDTPAAAQTPTPVKKGAP